ncbi:MAG: MFS transporter [Rhodospirillaceae bacterium]|nr:MFS transporter [Rhodospirillaceae bacterium]
MLNGKPSSGVSDSRFLYVILIIGGLITAIAFGVRQGFGIFLTPISLEFGFGREIFALAIALQNLVMGVAQPFVGAFADKFGAFRTIVMGTLLYSCGLILMAFSTTPDMFYLSAGVLAGVGLAGSGQSLIMPAVAKRFPAEKRSWVLGVVGATGSLGAFIALPVGQYFITNLGWSETSLITGFLLLIIIPLAFVFRSSDSSQPVETERKVSMKEALIEAFNHNGFWCLCAGFFVCGFHVVYIGVHLPSYVLDLGLSAETGAWALSIIGLMNIVGGYSAGVLGGKFPKKYLLSGLYLGRSLVMVGFILLPPSNIVVFAFAVFMGLFWLSTVPLTTGLVADLYGTRYMTMLYGIVFLSHQLGAFCGGWLGGYVYDTTGSYNLVWWIAVALGLISMLAHWPIRPLTRKELSPAV